MLTMPCYHPLTAYRSRAGRSPNGSWPIVFNIKEGYQDQKIELPCGQCIGCRLEKSRQWAVRCVLESKMYNQNSFITLTYNNQNLKTQCLKINDQNKQISTLNKRDFVLFMKKLRKEILKQYGKKIRFFHCGEYGERYSRPHHHAAIFNFDFVDKKAFSLSNGLVLYKSDFLDKTWGYGFCSVGELTFESAAYVARYITKKITGEAAQSHYMGREPEYTTMSRKPGIGREWYNKWADDVKGTDQVIVRNDLKITPPRYFDSILKITDPKLFRRLKHIRQQKIDSEEYDWQRLRVKEEHKQIISKRLKRSYENGHT